MENDHQRKCSITQHHIGEGIVIRATGTCSREGALAARSIIRGYILTEPDFIMFIVGDVNFEHVSDLIDICSDFIETKKPLYLIAPKPEVRAAFEKISCETSCHICETLEEALRLCEGKAA